MSEIDHADIYRGVRLRITELLSGLPDEQLDRFAPATPEWRVRDVVAHLAGATADIVALNLEGVATDEWTQAQVDARRTTPLVEVLDEWSRCSEIVEPMISSIEPLMQTMLLADAVTHEHDIRGALGLPGARDTDAIAFTFQGLSGAIGAQRGDHGALRIAHEHGDTVVGSGEPTAQLHTTRFEVVRAGVGRRSLDQIAAWDWEGDAQPETMVLARFAPPRADPLNE